ncbi:PaaI family thioesterase [Alkalicoccus halolimnae]|uniref:PaaI family thioesterase n=1 Tax=Alkalicoccus halolimnae TaxID=1667239 RepID=A0A5C7FHJ5_9BACI|nr:PaaI family thioesterase [Alkalicoccus halolimnae]TXF83278.1 PaaI family thioesterase [Alkalicoccus halolimnae]
MNPKFMDNPFDEFLNCTYERVTAEHIKVTVPVQPLFINSAGVFHGGIICSLADIAMCNLFELDENGQQSVVTVDLKTTFMKGARGDYLIGDAYLVKKGRTLNHTDCYIYNSAEELVAKVTGILANRE